MNLFSIIAHCTYSLCITQVERGEILAKFVWGSFSLHLDRRKSVQSIMVFVYRVCEFLAELCDESVDCLFGMVWSGVCKTLLKRVRWSAGQVCVCVWLNLLQKQLCLCQQFAENISVVFFQVGMKFIRHF